METKYVTPYAYEGRLDVCPWCKKSPVVLASPMDRWRVECVEDKCPINPMSFSYENKQDAVDHWNYLLGGCKTK